MSKTTPHQPCRINPGPLPRTLTFRHCWINLDDGWTQTVFHDGTTVTAVPEATAEYVALARQLGYGDDLKALAREHDILHTFLAERTWGGASPTIWAVAHGQEGCAELWEQEQEETRVLAFQRCLNSVGTGEDWQTLAPLIPDEAYRYGLLDEAARLLRPNSQSR